MKTKEIENILSIKNCRDYKRLSLDELCLLQDYIIILEKENNWLRGNADNVNLELIELTNELENRIDKAIDKLYCYGEVFDRKILQLFQKVMLGILKGEDNDC